MVIVTAPKTANVPAISRVSRIIDFAFECMRCMNFGVTTMVFSRYRIFLCLLILSQTKGRNE